MKIEHIGIWVKDLEKIKAFYEKYFNGRSGKMYTNIAKQFSSYFLNFDQGGPRLELMRHPDIEGAEGLRGFSYGLAHVAFHLENRETINSLTERLREDGFTIASEPRVTGDGYYESAVLDPEGNYVELCSSNIS